MGFINEVYIHERLDLGLPFNFMYFNLDSRYIDLYNELKIFIFHFAGWKPEVICKDESYEKSSPCSNYKSHVESLQKMNISIKSWNENPDKNIQHILNLQKT